MAMKKFILFSLPLHLLLHLVIAQDSSPTTLSSSVPTTTASLTPEMSASSVSSLFASLATASPQQPGGPSAGDVASSSSGDSNAGASGSSSGTMSISRGGIIALVVVASCICVFGAISAVLFYLAKKRSWKVRESIRRSARKVATALTPRRSTFPKDIHNQRKSSRGLQKIDEMPDVKRSRTVDVEKGDPKVASFELAEPPKKSKWAKKAGE